MNMNDLQITKCTLSDYDQIVSDIIDYWGSDRTLYAHHTLWIHEFGDTAYVIKEGTKVLAYLFGFYSQTHLTAYVHLAAVRESLQRQGLGRRLYAHFVEEALRCGCTHLKAITPPFNKKSISYHQSLGMDLLGSPNEEGIPVVKDYGGIGRDRVVFSMKIGGAK